MSSARVLQLLKRPTGIRSSAQGGVSFVRNAGGGERHHPQLPPFPPGPRQFEQLKNWMGSLGVFSATAFVTLCYFSDWKVIVGYIPFYNGKFKQE